jgi:transposase
MSESSLIDSDFEGRGMPRPFSDDLRRRAIEAVVGGASRHEAAERFEVGPSTVINWLRRWHDHGSAAAMPSGRRQGQATDRGQSQRGVAVLHPTQDHL